MADDLAYPYTPVPARMEDLLSKLGKMGRPASADQAWMKQQGYTGGNDMQTLATMRKLGMIGSDKKPTAFFDAFRNADGTGIADGVRKAYAELFELYPDANRKDTEALKTFFRSKTTAGEKVQGLTVRTFQTLCKFGDFEGSGPLLGTPQPEVQADKGKTKGAPRANPSSSGGLTLNVNIQLQLPPSADGEVYDKLFAAMGKHLKGLANLE